MNTLLGKILFCFSFVLCFYSYHSLAQTLSNSVCPMANQYVDVNEERRFVVNPSDIQYLIRTTSAYENIPLTQEIFIQTMIEAADRLNKIGLGTYVYAGTSTDTYLPDDFNGISGVCADKNRRNLILIKTLGGDNPNSLAARTQRKCLFNGVYYGYQIEFYMKNSDGLLINKWLFSVNGPGFSMATAAIHELGHTYNIEHPPSNIPSLAVMNSPTRILKEWDIRCMLYRSGQRSYSILFREVTSSGIGSEQVYINASDSLSSGVVDFAPGRFNFLWTSIYSLVYELSNVTRVRL